MMEQIKRIINIVRIEKLAVFGTDELGHFHSGIISIFPNVEVGQAWEITSEEKIIVEAKHIDKD
jgi:hypothetical protein